MPARHPHTWTIEFTPEAEAWYMGLNERDTHRIAAALDVLERTGPNLGREMVDSIKGSRYHNMKELRSVGGHLRALFAIDPQRHAVVLVGGDKQGDWKGWYKRNIPVADKRYERHLRSLGKEEPCPTRTPRTGARSADRGR
jgi:hypothetical protein